MKYTWPRARGISKERRPHGREARGGAYEPDNPELAEGPERDEGLHGMVSPNGLSLPKAGRREANRSDFVRGRGL
jgi:hypothetical protein